MLGRLFILIGPVLILASCAAALAQDAVAPGTPAESATAATAIIREIGPFGALAWGAYLLGGAAKRLGDIFGQVMEKGIPLRVELSENDREAIEGLTQARRAGGGRS
jgi:hypothetical protein